MSSRDRLDEQSDDLGRRYVKGTIFLAHWNAAEAERYAPELRSAEWEVEIEAEDGARACQRITASRPGAVVICLSRLPSHGRELGRSLRDLKATPDLPLVFVDGAGEMVETVRSAVPDAVFTAGTELGNVLGTVFESDNGAGQQD